MNSTLYYEVVSLESTGGSSLILLFDPLDVSDHIKDIIQFVVLEVLTAAVCLLGMAGNILNIVLFCRQGLTSSVNVSFLALSVADFLNVLITEWVSICFNDRFVNLQALTFFPPDVSYLTGGFPHACLSRITAWITVYMTAERCLCIALPFKVRALITVKGTVVIIISISCLTMIPLIPEYCFFFLDWTYFPQLNRTLLGLLPRLDRLDLEGISFLVYTVMMFTSFPAIVVMTTVLIVQLNKLSRWRGGAQASKDQAKALALKDKMAVRTVVVVACVLIVTFTPTVVFSALSFTIPGFHLKGRYSNIYIIFVSIAFFFDATNASVNTFLYYVMNRSFRKTFHALFSLGHKK
ncbi:FMRFamide receptor [Biomphalaria glabrata]|nr:FMRFamide receptor-like [Biomphalaria glabrata]